MRALLGLLAALVLSSCGGSQPTIGTGYSDPQGAYTMRVDPAWELHAGGLVEGVESWFIGPVENGFRPNVNVLSQAAQGMSLTDYINTSISQGPKFMPDFRLVSQSQFDASGVTLGELDYIGTFQGYQLHFLAVVGMRGDRAIVATLTAPLPSFDTWRASVEPYLRTLRPT
jgi:hypothetical protein